MCSFPFHPFIFFRFQKTSWHLLMRGHAQSYFQIGFAYFLCVVSLVGNLTKIIWNDPTSDKRISIWRRCLLVCNCSFVKQYFRLFCRVVCLLNWTYLGKSFQLLQWHRWVGSPWEGWLWGCGMPASRLFVFACGEAINWIARLNHYKEKLGWL